MTVEAQRLLSTSHRESTNRTYESAIRCYVRFCKTYDYKVLPVNEDVVLQYVAYLSLKKLQASTVKVYYSAIRVYSIKNGYGSPMDSFLRLKMAMRSIEINSRPQNKKLPITIELLSKIRSNMLNTYNDVLLAAALSLAFFGLLRASEFTVNVVFNPNIHLTLTDVTFHTSDEGMPYVKVSIKRSKTDHYNQGFCLNMGCTQTDMTFHVCPYCDLKQYVKQSYYNSW